MASNETGTTSGTDISSIGGSTMRIAEAGVLSALCLMCIVGNAIMWYVICSRREFRTSANALVLCLSTADLLVATVNMPMTVYALAASGWTFSDTTCVIFGFITMTTFIASVMSLGVISISRYVLICHSFRYKGIYTARRTGLMIAGTWLLSGILATPPLLGWGKYAYLEGQSLCFCDWRTSYSYAIFMIAVCFGGPCSIMTFCYTKILMEVRASRRRIGTQNKNSELKTKQNMNSKLKTNTSAVLEPTIGHQGGDVSNVQVDVKTPNNEVLSLKSCRNPKHGTRIVHITVSETSQNPCTDIYHLKTRNLENGKQFSGSHRMRVNFLKVPQDKHKNNLTAHASSDMSSINRTRSVPTNLPADDVKSEVSEQRSDLKRAATSSTLQVPSTTTQNKNIITTNNISRDFTSGISHCDGVSPESPVSGLDPSQQRTSSVQKRKRKEDIQLTTSFLVMILAFVICWFPYCVVMLWSVFSEVPVPRAADTSAIFLGYINSGCNPVIYGIMNHRFRKAILGLCSCCHLRPTHGVT